MRAIEGACEHCRSATEHHTVRDGLRRCWLEIGLENKNKNKKNWEVNACEKEVEGESLQEDRES